jgi:hypothetical protein
MTMNKIKSILKVLTFINLEIFVLISSMIFSISFGYKSIRDSIDSAKSISLEINKTEENRFKMIERLNDFSLLEDELLSKSLKNLNITDELDIYTSYKDSFDLSKKDSSIIDSLFMEKYILFSVIKSYKKSSNIKINKDDFKINKTTVEYIPTTKIVENKTKGKLFRKSKTKTDTVVKIDTIYNTTSEFDLESFSKINNINQKADYNSFQNYIFINNDLSYKIRLILNKRISEFNSENRKSQELLISKLNLNFSKYVNTIIFISIFFIITMLLLIWDIKKKSKVEYRNKYLISLLLNKK